MKPYKELALVLGQSLKANSIIDSRTRLPRRKLENDLNIITKAIKVLMNIFQTLNGTSMMPNSLIQMKRFDFFKIHRDLLQNIYTQDPLPDTYAKWKDRLLKLGRLQERYKSQFGSRQNLSYNTPSRVPHTFVTNIHPPC